MPEQTPLESYLNFLEDKDTIDTVPGIGQAQPQSPENPLDQIMFGDYPQSSQPISPESDKPAVDFMAQLLWGAVSGLTWGGSEFVAESKDWEKMNDWEKAGWVTGEGASIMTPIIGPFALLGKAGSTVTKFAGNKWMKKAAKELTQDTQFKNEIAQEMLKRGGSKDRLTKEVASKLGIELPKTMQHPMTIATLKELNTNKSLIAEKALKPQAAQIIQNVSDDMGLNLTTGTIENLSKNYMKGLKSGTYVNDIGEWVTRGLANKEGAGVISKYLGMAAQDFLYMGLHAAGQEKIHAVAEGRDAEYSERLMGSGIMALGFPLIRAIPGGGKENFRNAIKSYFTRYRNFNFKNLAVEDETAARGLLKVMAKGANMNTINHSALGESFWKAGGVKYPTGQNIWDNADTMPIENVVTLLNKMRLATSKEMLRRFRGNYFGDLWESKLRLGSGVLFMNEGVFRSGAFQDMSTQELSAHFAMAAFMTKSRGAWGHSEVQGYMHKQYGELLDGLQYLNVSKKNTISDMLEAARYEDQYRNRGSIYGLSETSPLVKKVFDSEIGPDTDTRDWRRPSSEGEAKTSDYPKLHNLLAVYNATRLINDKKATTWELSDINERTLQRLNSNIDSIRFSEKNGGKTVGETPHVELLQRFATETREEVVADYIDFFRTLPAEYGLSIDVAKGQRPTVKLIEPPEGQHYSNIHRFNDLLLQHGERLGFDIISSTQDTVKVSEIANARGISNKDVDSQLGEYYNGFLTSLNKKYQNYNFVWEINKNPLLDSLASIDAIQSKDSLFKTVMGIEGTDPNTISLREQFINMFAARGDRINESFYENVGHLSQADKKSGKSEFEPELLGHFETIMPFYDVFKQFGNIQVDKNNSNRQVKNTIDKTSIITLSESIKKMSQGLNGHEKLNYFETLKEAFNQRILAGGSQESFIAIEAMREVGIGDVAVENGLPKVRFETDELVDLAFGREDAASAAKVKQAIHSLKNIFPKQMVGDKVEAPMLNRENLLEYITIQKDVSSGRDKRFLNDITPILDSLGDVSIGSSQIEEMKDLTQKMSDLTKDGKVLDIAEFNQIKNSIDTIIKTLDKENLISKEHITQLKDIVAEVNDRSRTFARGEYGTGADTEIFSDIVNSYNVLIKETISNDYLNKDKLANLVIRLQKGTLGQSQNISFAQSKIYRDSLEQQIKKVLGKTAEENIPISEMIKEFNDTNNWQVLGEIVEGVYKGINAKNPEQNAYINASTSILRSLEHEKMANHQPRNVQQMLQTYPSIRNPLDSNKINDRFPVEITDAINNKNPDITIDTVFDKWIYKYIRRDAKNPEKAEELINDFKFREAAPLLQSMFSSKERSTLTFDHGAVEKRSEKLRDSLSTTVLDRRNSNGGGYHYDILKGAIKIGNRTVEMDSSYELGGNWILMQNWVDKSKIVDMDSIEKFYLGEGRYDNKLTIDNIDDLKDGIEPYYKDGESRGLADSPLIYMRLSPAMRILFHRSKENIRKLEKDFKIEYENRMDSYKGNDSLIKQLEQGFKWLRETTDTSNDVLRTKMMFVHTNRIMPAEFDKLMNTKAIGRDTGKVEFNAFKRGFLADGGTTSQITMEASTWMSQNHPNQDVQAYAATKVQDPFFRALVIDDEATGGQKTDEHFFSIKRLVKKKMDDREATSVDDSFENKIIKEFNKELDGEFESINESFFLDGGKILGKGLSQFSHALKGRAEHENWNGLKTIIQDRNVLGKGFSVNIPEMDGVLQRAKVDMVIGKTVAKTLSRTGREGNAKVEPFLFDGTQNLEDGWYNQINNRTKGSREDRAVVKFPMEHLSVSFTSHEEPGVHYSNSQLDFQDLNHFRSAKKLYKIDEIIAKVRNVSENANLSNGSLLRALYDIRQRETGLQLTSDNFTLSEQLLDYGAREGNFLVQESIKQLLQSEYYRLLTKRPTRHGEEGFLMADYKNELELPVYAKMHGEIPDVQPAFDVASVAEFTRDKNNFRTVYQYGEGTITDAMAKAPLESTTVKNIVNLPFIYRDVNGVDVTFALNADGKTIENHSSFYSAIYDNPKEVKMSVRGIEGDVKKSLVKADYSNIERVIKNIQSKIASYDGHLGIKSSATYGDVMTLIEGGYLGKDKKLGFKLKNEDIEILKEGKVSLGMSSNAIPKVLKDQPMLRVKRALEKELNGLSTVNAYDLRATLQRDYDGDHFFKYMRIPMDMLKNYMNDMGDIPDYPMHKNKTFEHMDGIAPNMFGFGANGEAGREIGLLGMDKMAHHVATEKRNIATVISLKGTLSHLSNSKVLFNKQPLVDSRVMEKNYNLPENVLRAYQETGILNQNALDLWSGKHPAFNERGALENFYLYRTLPPDISHSEFGGTEKSFFQDGFGKSPVERKAFDIIHRTLKKVKLVENRTYDDSGKRQPTPDELIRAKNDINEFYDGPDEFIINKMLGEIKMLRRNGKRSSADKLRKEMIQYFWDTSKTDLTTKEIIEEISSGRLSDTTLLRRKEKFTIADGAEGYGLKSSMSGYTLNKMLERNTIFYNRDAGKFSNNRNMDSNHQKTYTEKLRKVDRSIERMYVDGNKSVDEVLETLELNDSVLANTRFSKDDSPSVSMKKANERGILLHLTETTLARELNYYRSLEREAFPDQNKLDRSADRIDNLHLKHEMFARQDAAHAVLRKDKDLVYYKIPKSDDYKYSNRKVPSDGVLYELSRDIGATPDKKDIYKHLKYYDTVRAEQRVSFEAGKTYILDRNPVRTVVNTDPDVKWHMAYEKATNVGMLQSVDLIDYQNKPLKYAEFVESVRGLKKQLYTISKDTMFALRGSTHNKKDKYKLSGEEINHELNKFFDRWAGEVDGGFEALFRYILQPNLQRNIYRKDGLVESPYYKPDMFFTNKVLNWVANWKMGKDDGTSFDKYGVDREQIVRDLVTDMNSIHDARTDEIEYRARQYMRGRLGGNEEWESFYRTTKHALLDHWFAHPVLSEYMKDLYGNFPNITRGKDQRGRMQYMISNRGVDTKNEFIFESFRGCY